jgi:hypothetical protein
MTKLEIKELKSKARALYPNRKITQIKVCEYTGDCFVHFSDNAPTVSDCIRVSAYRLQDKKK